MNEKCEVANKLYILPRMKQKRFDKHMPKELLSNIVANFTTHWDILFTESQLKDEIDITEQGNMEVENV